MRSTAKPSTWFLIHLALIGAGALISSGHPARAQSAGPFDGLGGSWSGSGSIGLADGSTERLRCQATYAVTDGGDALRQNLQCKSDSYDFDLRIDLANKNGQILGSWDELRRQIQGGIAGRGSKGVIDVTVRGQAFSAAVSIATHGAQQSVTIHAPSGDLSKISIVLHHTR